MEVICGDSGYTRLRLTKTYAAPRVIRGMEQHHMQYVLAIHKDPDSGYGVTVPNLPGCFSAGATLDAAIEAAREAILLHLEGMDAEGIEIQERALEQLQADPEFARAAASPHRSIRRESR